MRREGGGRPKGTIIRCMGATGHGTSGQEDDDVDEEEGPVPHACPAEPPPPPPPPPWLSLDARLMYCDGETLPPVLPRSNSDTSTSEMLHEAAPCC